MKKLRVRIISLLLILQILVCSQESLAFGGEYNKKTTEKYLNTIATKLMSTYDNPTFGSTGGEWTVIGLARDGSIGRDYLNVYKKNLQSYVEECKGNLSNNKYTEYSRVVLAVTAIGENAENFAGYNLAEVLCDYEKVTMQGINGMCYGLLALDSGDYCDGASDKGKDARTYYINEILESQLKDGGWCLTGNKADVDITALCVQALTKYIEDAEVKNAVDKAVEVLSKAQCETGGFSSLGNENCESTAQVLIALSGLGLSVSDERFVKDGNNVVDGLMQYYKDGAFSHLKGKSKNSIATDQAMCGLVAHYRNISGDNRLYDMSDGLQYREIGEIIQEEANQSASKEVTKQTNSTVNKDDAVIDTGSDTLDKEDEDTNTKDKSEQKNKSNKKKNNVKDNDKTNDKATNEKNKNSIQSEVKNGEENNEVANNKGTENNTVESAENVDVKSETANVSDGKENTDTTEAVVLNNGDVDNSESVVANEEVSTDINEQENVGEIQTDNTNYYIRIAICLLVIALALGFDRILIIGKKIRIKK